LTPLSSTLFNQTTRYTFQRHLIPKVSKKIRQLRLDKRYPGCSRSNSARSALCAKTPAPKNKSVAFTGMVVASFLNVLGCAAAAALAGVGTRRNVKQGAA